MGGTCKMLQHKLPLHGEMGEVCVGTVLSFIDEVDLIKFLIVLHIILTALANGKS